MSFGVKMKVNSISGDRSGDKQDVGGERVGKSTTKGGFESTAGCYPFRKQLIITRWPEVNKKH